MSNPAALMEQPVEVPVEPVPQAVADPRTWTRLAACAGKTHLFYAPPAERPEARAVRELKASLLCRTCPVVAPCREWAREYREYGFWGNESEESRAAAGFRVRLPNATRRARRGPNRAA
jgi:WhiB family transcriptional regulator, redox-sensing transcriptional regulator